MAYVNHTYPTHFVNYPSVTGSNVSTAINSTAYPAQTNPITWVQGEAGAKAQFVSAGQSALFMDSEEPVFYIKTVDASGFPQPLRIFDFTERIVEPVSESEKLADYVTKDDLEDMVNKLVDKKLKSAKGGKK